MVNPKFIAVVSYKAMNRNFDYVYLHAKSILKAIKEANTLFAEDVYAIEIYKRKGKPVKIGSETNLATYVSVLRSDEESNDWNIMEDTWFMRKYYIKGRNYYNFYLKKDD